MANLSTADQVGMLSREDSLYIIQGGKVKRITADKLAEQINQGDEALLRQVAWGIPIKQGIQSDPHWGTCGNWDLYNEYKAKVGRYLVKADGTAAKLNRTDSSVYADGTSLDETKGNVMVIGPRLYYRVQDDALAGCPVLWMSEQPIGGHWLSNAGEHNCYAAYKGAMENSKLVSRSGQSPIGSKSVSQWWTAAQVNGSDWGLLDYDGYRWHAMLCMCEAEGWMDVQSALGYGIRVTTSQDVTSSLTGATTSLGDETSSIPLGEKACRVNVCGFEDAYGWNREVIQGIVSNVPAVSNGHIYAYNGNRIITMQQIQAGISGEQREIASGDWKIDGSIASMALGERFDLVPVEQATNYKTKWCDKGLMRTSSVNAYSVSVGCGLPSENTDGNGPFAFQAYIPWASNVESSRLGYYGPIKFTDGRNI